MVDALYDQERGQYKAIVAYAFDRCSPFPIARLELLASAISIYICNNHAATDNPHHETRLVEVVEVLVLDVVLRTYVGYQLEPYVYLVGVFAEGPLEVVHICHMRLEVGAAIYEAVCPHLADGQRATRREEGIRHIFHTTNPGRESSRIEVEDISYKRLFFGQSQIMSGVTRFGLQGTALHSVVEGAFGDVV